MPTSFNNKSFETHGYDRLPHLTAGLTMWSVLPEIAAANDQVAGRIGCSYRSGLSPVAVMEEGTEKTRNAVHHKKGQYSMIGNNKSQSDQHSSPTRLDTTHHSPTTTDPRITSTQIAPKGYTPRWLEPWLGSKSQTFLPFTLIISSRHNERGQKCWSLTTTPFLFQGFPIGLGLNNQPQLATPMQEFGLFFSRRIDNIQQEGFTGILNEQRLGSAMYARRSR